MAVEERIGTMARNNRGHGSKRRREKQQRQQQRKLFVANRGFGLISGRFLGSFLLLLLCCSDYVVAFSTAFPLTPSRPRGPVSSLSLVPSMPFASMEDIGPHKLQGQHQSQKYLGGADSFNRGGTIGTMRRRVRFETTRRVLLLSSSLSTAEGEQNKDSDPDTNTVQRSNTAKHPDSRNYRWTSRAMALALPALIGMLADPLLSLMDTVCVGRLSTHGTRDLAALGACTSLFHLAFNAFRATTAATTSLVGKSSSEEERREIVSISLRLGLGLGLGVAAVLRFAGPWCLACMGVPRTSPLFDPSRAYLFARCPAAPAVLLATVAEGAFRGYGDTKIPLLASGAAALLNVVLDPLLMLPPFSMGVRGAALATAMAQFGALGVYAVWLRKRKMLPQPPSDSVVNGAEPSSFSSEQRRGVIKAILGANLAMVGKQGSLLLAWACATARATRIGPAHVAAHQVGLSVWLVLALIQDGAGVAAQVLLAGVLKAPATTNAETSPSGNVAIQSPIAGSRYHKARSLVSYMAKFSVLQGLVATGVLLLAAPFLPGCFVSGEGSEMVRTQLVRLLPHVALQQLLVGPTLVAEALAAGGGRFGLLAAGTGAATVLALWQLRTATTVASIWSRGIVTLFVGRLATAVLGTVLVLRECRREEHSESAMAAPVQA